MAELAKKCDRLEAALSNFGQVLYYAPEDKDGFWIDKSVVNILNASENDKIRSGYNVEAFNSVGVVNDDGNGTVWLELEKKWKKRADSLTADKFRFKESLENLAKEFHYMAEKSIEEWY